MHPRQEKHEEILLPFKAHFLHNDGKFLTDYSKLRLKTLIELTKQEKDIKLVIVGHQDNEMEDVSKSLAQERARTVYNYLVKNGLSHDQLLIKDSESGVSSKVWNEEKGIKRRKVEFYLSN